MFEALNHEQKKRLLRDFLKSPSSISPKEVKDILKHFPFSSQELNYLSLQVLRQRRDIVPTAELARKLRTDEDTVQKILSSEETFALFPVASNKEAKLIRALLIPLSKPGVILLGDKPTESLKLIGKLLKRGFLVVFDSDFDWKKSSSYMLSLYASLVLQNRFKDVAFTGIITPEGRLEDVQFLKKKKELCRQESIPLIYPSDCMRDLKDLEKFLTSLTVPLASLPGKDPTPFLKSFPFDGEYIRDVFHIDRPLVYTERFEETVESFESFAMWLEETASQLKHINENHLPIRIGTTGIPLCMTFYTGVVLSKSRVPVEFYQFDNGKYRLAFTLTSDREVPDTAKAQELVELYEPQDYKNIYIRMKTQTEKDEDTLEIKIPEGEALDKNVLEIAFLVNKKLRMVKGCKTLFMEASVPFSFALGYFLEDYVCLLLTHKTKVVYTLRPPQKGKLYLLNAFSLNMLEKSRAIIDVREVSKEKALELLQEPFESCISHQSTAQVLSNMLGREIEMRREPVKLKDGDRALIFQIKVRPTEGQVFTQEEVNKIVEEGLFSFFLVEVSC